MKHQSLRNVFLLFLMLFTVGLAFVLRPTQKIAEQGLPMNLKAMIPARFGGWSEEPVEQGQIVDPQQSVLLSKLYSQILSRTYKNSSGNRVMLSIAYGSDQRDTMQVHYPEVCYPAQGFQLQSQEVGKIDLADKTIPVRRLDVRLGGRHEFVTYWVMIGDIPVLGGADKKMAELRYGLKGYIPDGLLFRVSSIGENGDVEYKAHTRFIQEMVKFVPPDYSNRFFGGVNQATESKVLF